MKPISIIVLFLGPFVLYYCLRSVAVRAVLFFMMRGHSPQPAALEASGPEPSAGKPSRGEILVESFDSQSEIVLTGHQEERWRRTQKMGTRTLTAFLPAVLFGALVLAAAEYSGFSADLPGNPDLASTVFACAAIWGVVLFLGAAACRIRTGRLTPPAVAVITVLGTGLIFVVVDLLLRDHVSPERLQNHFLYSLAAPAVVWLSWTLLIKLLGRRARADGNWRLGILRVFDSDKNAVFLFKKMARRWCFTGASMTIADPAYVRQLFSRYTLSDLSQSLFVLGVYFIGKNYLYKFSMMAYFGTFNLNQTPLEGRTVYGQFLDWSATALGFTKSDFELMAEQIITGIDLYLFLIPLMLVTFVWLALAFTRNADAAIRKIDAAGRAKLRAAAYKPATLYCYDNVWKAAVDRMMETANVIVMDLRGFSQQRKGSAYEIGKLIDRYPIERTLFLVDSKTPSEPIVALIRERWHNMSGASPNANLETAAVRLYHCGMQDKRDTPRILRLLCAMMDRKDETIRAASAASAG